jgi:Glycosyl hydrolase family 12
VSRPDTLARTYRRRLLMAAIVLITVIGARATMEAENTATSAPRSIPSATPAAAPSSSSSPPPTSGVHFNFQNGTTEGWMSGWGPVSVASSTAHAFTGSHSLAITTQGGYSAVGANVVGVAAGTSVTYHLFSPSGGVPVMPFVTDTSWANHFAGHATLAQGWNTVTWTVPQVSVSRIGLQVNLWSGTLYLGTVTWGGGVPSETPAPGPTAAPTPASAPAATPTSAPTATQGPSGPLTLSGYQVASLLGGRYKLQANEYNSTAPLTLTSDGHPGFTVTASGISVATDGAPGAYPSLFRGCHWGDCTADSGMPISVAKVEHPGTVTTTDQTSTVPGGAWDDSYDIWFNPDSAPSDNASGGLEMMIWLDHEGPVEPAGQVVASDVSIGGHVYNVWYSGHTVSYVLSSPSSSVTDLDLAPLAADAVSRGYMPSSWWLIDVEAGFEPWQGGQGLAITSFNVCDPAGC